MSLSSRDRDRIALAAVCLTSLMFGLEITSVPAILPALETALPATFQQLEWIVNAYTVAMTAFLMASGAMADRYGRKRILMTGIVVFGIASIACGLVNDAPALIAARSVQGIAGAAMLACQVAVLAHQFRDPKARRMAFGCWGIVFGSGLGFGPLVGGATIALLTWRWVFLIHGLLAICAFCFARSGITESSDPKAVRIDLPGMATLSFAVFCLVYVITRGKLPGRDDPVGAAIAILAVLGFASFLLAETRADRPMFDFRIFRNRTFSGALFGSAAMNFSFWPFVIFLHSVLGFHGFGASAALLAYTIPTLIAPPLGERLLLRYGPRFIIPFGLFTIGAGFAVMVVALNADAGTGLFLLGCFIAGTGLGLVNTPVTNKTTASVGPDRAGMASGTDMSARMISLSLNIALMGFLLLQSVRSGLAAIGLDRMAMAGMIAAGDLRPAGAEALSPTMLRSVLAHAFSNVMLYAMISAWTLSALSFVTFGKAKDGGPQRSRIGDVEAEPCG